MEPTDQRHPMHDTDSRDVLVSFDEVGTKFARDYLATYYSGPEPTYDEQVVMTFCAKHYRAVTGSPEMLELGSGPTLHHVISAVPHVSKIHMSDYLEGCLDEIKIWKAGNPCAHDWRVFTRYALSVEGAPCDELSVFQREQDLRDKLDKIELCDVRDGMPTSVGQKFEVIACFYTAEQAVMAKEDWPHQMRLGAWHEIMDNICSCVSEGGLLLMAGVRDSDHYVTYDSSTGRALIHPLPRLLEEDYAAALDRNGFDMSKSTVESAELVGQESEGLTGVILVAGRKL